MSCPPQFAVHAGAWLEVLQSNSNRGTESTRILLDEIQFPTIHPEVFTGGILSVHAQVDFVFVSQRNHCGEVNLQVLSQGDGNGFPIHSVMKVNADLLVEVALHGDEIKPITVNDD